MKSADDPVHEAVAVAVVAHVVKVPFSATTMSCKNRVVVEFHGG